MSEPQPLNPDQREIVELLCDDLAETMAEGGEGLAEESTRRDCLRQFQAHAEQLAKAMALAGLSGLTRVCQNLTDNFTSLLRADTELDADFIDHVSAWPMALLAYLHLLLENADDEQAWTDCIEELITYLSDRRWPQPLEASTAQDVAAALSNASVEVEKQTAAAHLIVDDATASLDYGDDVRQELVHGLLTELPEQGRLFETSISHYLKNQVIDSLAPAQRVAHTIKGSANIVGVQGLANLMHLCEDLLIDLDKGKPLDTAIEDLLMDAADCLGDICDYLTGLAPKPDSVAAVLQALVDCLNDEATAPIQSTQDAGDDRTDDEAIAFEGLDELDQIETLGEAAPATSPDSEGLVELQSLTFGSQSQEEPEPEPEPEPPTIAADNNADKVDSDTDQAAAAADSTPPPMPAIPTPAVVDATESEDAESGQLLSISQGRAQQLLRIAGENTIANTQVMAQLEGMRASIEQTERYHKRIKHMALELEALMQTQNALRSAMYRSRVGDQQNNDEFDPLEMESYSELHSFSNQLLELTADSYEGISHIEEQIDELTSIAYAQKQLNRDNNELLLQTHMVPVDNIVPRLQRCVRQACRLTKKTATLDIIGDTLQVDNRVLSRIVDPLMHLLRNAVDHGIETDEERMAAGKDPTGAIVVEFVQRGEIIVIECRDDGRGIDYQTIQQKAVEKGLLEAQDQVDDSALNHLLFLPGFSTRASASQTSGRGIGLDVVQDEVKQLKGSAQVSNNADGGCCFTLTLPASILTAHALLVNVQDKQHRGVLSILSRGIHNVVYLEGAELQNRDGTSVYEYNEQTIPVMSLHDLSGTTLPENDRTGALLIVERNQGDFVAVSVDSVVASQDLVIKPLNDFTYRPPGVVGATILGDGTVSPVVDLQELPGMNMDREEFARLQAQREAITAQERARDWQLPTALIIDDSLSARQSLAQFVGELGMQVKTAKDGFEAIAVMNDVRPSVILVDLEMPRMNGLEFTTHLRADADKADIPVIMITSRSTDKHRQMALNAGVDDYLNKPWSDETLLTSIQKQMEGKRQELTANS